ncbi:MULTISPECIES: class I SAM-dependent methyltransferase [unclassified Agarivorans]|uniref:class I SAM-dependent methyltransferase n=1 Tax=unclassified Agarivorans TaxID=2636026 RepID=UPI0026E23D6B|nr:MULTISPECIES: class I SAM-dependent methyltransferase [unclassified Agarivorans]MDO6684716.1 class I SAM-dependent methyltransferase [Agarivorans sp. 3_MG-2023]MDO6715123.1 class I SAM-dependent methyltransferase [Agarivorans sp. 2_MG-2023]
METNNKTLESNRKVHSLLLKNGDYQNSPHFRQENQDKVKRTIISLMEKAIGNKKLIDFGCGTGFIINLTKNLFDEVHGVDITQEMMDEIDTTSGNITLTNSIAEHTPYPNDEFHFATAYSFMDHLSSYETFLKEVFRVLCKGGVFYSDLNPNRSFINALEHTESSTQQNNKIITREIQAGLHNGAYYQDKYGIDPETMAAAEPIKSFQKGFSEEEIRQTARKIGFSECYIEYEWYVDQGSIIHDHSPTLADEIDQYLKSILPLSSSLYKYLKIVLIK